MPLPAAIAKRDRRANVISNATHRHRRVRRLNQEHQAARCTVWCWLATTRTVTRSPPLTAISKSTSGAGHCAAVLLVKQDVYDVTSLAKGAPAAVRTRPRTIETSLSSIAREEHLSAWDSGRCRRSMHRPVCPLHSMERQNHRRCLSRWRGILEVVVGGVGALGQAGNLELDISVRYRRVRQHPPPRSFGECRSHRQ